jgi:hypothetical protein
LHLWGKAIEEALLARERLESGGGSPTLLLQADARLDRATLAAEKKDRQVVVVIFQLVDGIPHRESSWDPGEYPPAGGATFSVDTLDSSRYHM